MISAIAMVAMLYIFSVFDAPGILVFLLLVGVLLVDEFMVKMLKQKRIHFGYVVSQFSFVFSYILFNFLDYQEQYFSQFIKMGLVVNGSLLVYLFKVKMNSMVFVENFKKLSFGAGLFFLFPILCISSLLHFDNWGLYVLFFLIFNFSIDTGAWFFGRNFGKNKLWPSISPKKTWEGAIGGSILSVIIAVSFSYFYLNKINFLLITSFTVLSILAQLGDLIESKLKRQLGIKDSSNLIPGHGGIYDRIDSLIFLAPFFVYVMTNFY
jgi:phosphatidate cytidylyltransferase